MKKHTTLSVDHELIQKAKDKNINISELTEEAIKDKLGEVDVAINTDVSECEFCGREGKIETRKDIEPVTNTKDPLKHPALLTWLYPDARWICNTCLRDKAKRILPK